MLKVVIFREKAFEKSETHETHESILDQIVEPANSATLIADSWRAK